MDLSWPSFLKRKKKTTQVDDVVRPVTPKVGMATGPAPDVQKPVALPSPTPAPMVPPDLPQRRQWPSPAVQPKVAASERTDLSAKTIAPRSARTPGSEFLR